MLRILVCLLLVILPASAWGEFRPCTNETAIDELQALCDLYHFTRTPELDVFDCVDMSTANYRFLKEKGYEPMIAIRRDYKSPNPKDGHCYAIVPLGVGWAGVETQGEGANLTHSIGRVITSVEVKKICRTPEEVLAIDPRGAPVITGQVIAPN